MVNQALISQFIELFESADAIRVDDGPILYEKNIFKGEKNLVFGFDDNVLEIIWDSEGLHYQINITAEKLSKATVEGGRVYVENDENEVMEIQLFKLENLIDGGVEVAFGL